MRIRRCSSVSGPVGTRAGEFNRIDDGVCSFGGGTISISSCRTSSSFLIELWRDMRHYNVWNASRDQTLTQ